MNTTYQVTQPASFSTIAMTRIVKTVSERVSFYLVFNLPFPVQTGAYLQVTFPSTYTIIPTVTNQFASSTNKLFSSAYTAMTPTTTTILIQGNNGNALVNED
jgi:hypothetical protein